MEQSGAHQVVRTGQPEDHFSMTAGIGSGPESLAQFAAVDADLLAIKPRNMPMREA